MNLYAYQQEMKKLLFYREDEASASPLWKDGIPERLRLYRNNTRLNWLDALNSDFSLTRKQFSDSDWRNLARRYFIKHPAGHWELNQSMAPFPKFLATQKVKPYIKELADYEWNDLAIFIHRAVVRQGTGLTNPTVAIRVYQHQIFFWAEAEAPADKPPLQKPEVLAFYRDSGNTCHIIEADPLMILLMEHFRKPGASLEDLEPLRRQILPDNQVSLETALASLREMELIL